MKQDCVKQLVEVASRFVDFKKKKKSRKPFNTIRGLKNEHVDKAKTLDRI